MKFVLCIALFAIVAVVVRSNQCVNHDASACTHTCPDGESKVCEMDVCTCAMVTKCADKADCPDCKSMTDPMGHTHMGEKHCMDGACICMHMHMPPHMGGGHMGGN